MNLDELEIRATLYTGSGLKNYVGRYATVHHYFLDHPTHSRVAVLRSAASDSLFMFLPSPDNQHLVYERPEAKSCLIETCYKQAMSNGFCLDHSQITKFCSIDNCNNRHYAKDLCNKHYQQERRNK